MKEDILISVIVPTFNRVKELERCISSVIKQSYPNWELIIIDDRSTDDSFELIQQTIKSDSRIKLLKRSTNRHKGANACRNFGVEKSKGKYIAFLDSDDLWSINRLENALNFIGETGANAIYSGAIEVSCNGERYRKSRAIRENESAFDYLIAYESYAPTPSMVVNADVLNNVKFDEMLQRHQDFDFFIKVSQFTDWVYFESKDIIVYNDQLSPKKIDFESCIAFYKTHKEMSLIRKNRIYYLNYISESCAKVNPNIKALNYYKSQLIQEGSDLTLRQKFLFKCPYVFYTLFKIKVFLKKIINVH
ncbi:glycosyltransferase family 2 protein [Algoriphagus halophytocola]|uniref:Glycosyltransferase n=1 Tax=Algoriphagus halophytocola TaxID=2991499 RepID=A0ABY6MP10_9BACT|nr:glycosyltransferase family 2 protein [Algoriphagus sp. TR-M5]UZD23934.1 glycosyltransferase [Algoriphagus sp. TR-M5]